MTKLKLIGASSFAAGVFMVFAAGAANAAAMPVSAAADVGRTGFVQVEDVQFRGRRVAGPRFAGPRVGRVYGGRRYGGRAVGAGIAAGVIGGLIGGAILGAQPTYAAPAPVYEEPVYVGPGRGDPVAWCMRRYRSYDPRTGTYVGLDGIERSCP